MIQKEYSLKKRISTILLLQVLSLSVGCSSSYHRAKLPPVTSNLERDLSEAEAFERQGNYREAESLQQKAIDDAWKTRDYTQLGLVYLILAHETHRYPDQEKKYQENAREFFSYVPHKERRSFQEHILAFLRQHFPRLLLQNPQLYQGLEQRVKTLIRD